MNPRPRLWPFLPCLLVLACAGTPPIADETRTARKQVLRNLADARAMVSACTACLTEIGPTLREILDHGNRNRTAGETGADRRSLNAELRGFLAAAVSRYADTRYKSQRLFPADERAMITQVTLSDDGDMLQMELPNPSRFGDLPFAERFKIRGAEPADPEWQADYHRYLEQVGAARGILAAYRERLDAAIAFNQLYTRDRMPAEEELRLFNRTLEGRLGELARAASGPECPAGERAGLQLAFGQLADELRRTASITGLPNYGTEFPKDHIADREAAQQAARELARRTGK